VGWSAESVRGCLWESAYVRGDCHAVGHSGRSGVFRSRDVIRKAAVFKIANGMSCYRAVICDAAARHAAHLKIIPYYPAKWHCGFAL
jgi:hypothetical protein